MTEHQHLYPNPPDELDRIRGIAKCQVPDCDFVADLVIGQLAPPGSTHVNRLEGRFKVDPATRRITERLTPLLPPTPVRPNRGYTPLPEYKQFVACRISRQDWSWLVEQSTETGSHIDAITTRLLAEAIDRTRTESPAAVG